MCDVRERERELSVTGALSFTKTRAREREGERASAAVGVSALVSGVFEVLINLTTHILHLNGSKVQQRQPRNGTSSFPTLIRLCSVQFSENVTSVPC